MEENDMAQEVTNFARFYAAFNRLPCTGDREELKRAVVRQYTWNRTDSLREMARHEYEDCCQALERLTGQTYDVIRAELRRRRSACLKLMQQMGVDTTDWERVNQLCRHPRLKRQPKYDNPAPRSASSSGRTPPKTETDMERKSEQTLEILKKEIVASTLDMENEEAAEFFNALADWAYVQAEAMLIDNDLEMQDYENEE